MSMHTCYKFRHINADGRIVWASSVGDVDVPVGSADELDLIDSQGWELNALLDQGEENILDVYFRGATAPTSFYMALLTAAPAETATIAGVTEARTPGANGYQRQILARNTTDWPALALNSGDDRVTSIQRTFGPATGSAWTAATHLAIVTTASGTTSPATLLVAAVDLSSTRTRQIGDSLAVTYSLTLS